MNQPGESSNQNIELFQNFHQEEFLLERNSRKDNFWHRNEDIDDMERADKVNKEEGAEETEVTSSSTALVQSSSWPLKPAQHPSTKPNQR